MIVCKNEIRDAVEAELTAANEKHPLFVSLHEAYAVTLEELEEAADELRLCFEYIHEAWKHIKDDNIQGALDRFAHLGYRTQRLAQEACQVSAMAIKAESSLAEKMDLEG